MKVFINISFLVAFAIVAINQCQVQAQGDRGSFISQRNYGGPSISQHFVDRRGDLITQESYHQSSYYPSHHGHGHYGGGGGGGGGGYGHGWHGHGWHGHHHHRPRRVYHIYHGGHNNGRSRVLPTLLAGFAAGSAIAIGAGLASGTLGK